MANYTNFTQVLRDRKGTNERRIDFVRGWLDKTYGIDFDQNPEYFAELTRVHDHDNQPLHFGKVPYQTFVFSVAELVKNDKGQWRIAVAFEQDESDRTTLQPVNQPDDQRSEANRNALLKYITAITATPLLAEPEPVSTGLLRFGPGDGSQYSSIATLTAAGEREHDLHAPYSPVNIPGFLTLPEDQIVHGVPVDISRWLAKLGGVDATK